MESTPIFNIFYTKTILNANIISYVISIYEIQMVENG